MNDKSLRLFSRSAIGAIGVTAVLLVSCTGGPKPGGWFGAGGSLVPDSGTQPSTITLSGVIVDDEGTPVPDATLTVGSSTVGMTAIDGSFTFTTTGSGSITIKSANSSLAPGFTVVPLKPGVYQYVVPITMATLQQLALSTSGATTITVPMLGQPVEITIPAGAPAGSMVRIATYDPSTALPPGIMQPSGDPTSGLRTAGMFYYDIVDPIGNPIATPPAGVAVNIPPVTLRPIPDSQPFNQWQMGDDGAWMNPTPTAQPGPSTPVRLSPTQFGFWNSDHGYRTACVTGTVGSNSGACGGARVQALGPDHLSSFDSSGADGSFCVTGAQTLTSNLHVGSSSMTVTMPAAPGDCAHPETCEAIGMVMVTDEQCQAGTPGADAGTGDAGGCGQGMFRCQDGTCIAASVVCNGVPNCPDDSDESPAICNDMGACCVATNNCPGETGDNCGDGCCCCPGGEACCANMSGCCASP